MKHILFFIILIHISFAKTSPSQILLENFQHIEKAETAIKDEEKLSLYLKAYQGFLQLKADHSNWNESIVSFRVEFCEKKIQELEQKLNKKTSLLSKDELLTHYVKSQKKIKKYAEFIVKTNSKLKKLEQDLAEAQAFNAEKAASIETVNQLLESEKKQKEQIASLQKQNFNLLDKNNKSLNKGQKIIASLQKELTTVKSQNKTLEQEIKKNEILITKNKLTLQEQKATTDKIIKNLTKQKELLSANLKKSKISITSLEQQFLDYKKKNIQESNTKQQQEIKNLTKENFKLSQDLNLEKKQNKENQASIKKLNDLLKSNENKQILTLKEENNSLNKKNSNLVQELNKLTKEHTKIIASSTLIEKENTKLAKEVVKLKLSVKQITPLQAKLLDEQKYKEEYKNKLATKEITYKELEKTYKTLEQQQNLLQEKLKKASVLTDKLQKDLKITKEKNLTKNDSNIKILEKKYQETSLKNNELSFQNKSLKQEVNFWQKKEKEAKQKHNILQIKFVNLQQKNNTLTKKEKEEILLKNQQIKHLEEQKNNLEITALKYKNLLNKKQGNNKYDVNTAKKDNRITLLLYSSNKKIKAKDFQTAIGLLKQVIELDENNFQALKTLGLIYYNKQDYLKAKDYLLKAIVHDLNDHKILHALGSTLLKTKDIFLAFSFLSRSIALDKNNPANHYFFAINLYKIKWYQAAKEQFLQALKLDPKNHQIPYNLALIYLTKEFKDIEQAKKWYKTAIKLGSERDPRLEKTLNILQR